MSGGALRSDHARRRRGANTGNAGAPAARARQATHPARASSHTVTHTSPDVPSVSPCRRYPSALNHLASPRRSTQVAGGNGGVAKFDRARATPPLKLTGVSQEWTQIDQRATPRPTLATVARSDRLGSLRGWILRPWPQSLPEVGASSPSWATAANASRPPARPPQGSGPPKSADRPPTPPPEPCKPPPAPWPKEPSPSANPASPWPPRSQAAPVASPAAPPAPWPAPELASRARFWPGARALSSMGQEQLLTACPGLFSAEARPPPPRSLRRRGGQPDGAAQTRRLAPRSRHDGVISEGALRVKTAPKAPAGCG